MPKIDIAGISAESRHASFREQIALSGVRGHGTRKQKLGDAAGLTSSAST